MAKHRSLQRGERRTAANVQAEEPTSPALRVSRREVFWLLAILAAGALLRWAFLSRVAVEHFDEGVYASNIWFGREASYQYPMRHLYAPPLLPALIEAAVIGQQIIGPTSAAPAAVAVMLPSLLAGCLTPLALWWLARRWFSPPVAVAAAALAACSDIHVLYSRAALTDCLLVLFVVVAVGWIERAVTRGGVRAILAAGALTAAAWWTKYNGWLPLAIGAAGAGLSCLIDVRARTSVARMAARGGAIAAIALVAWLPVLISLQKFGGYPAVAANHARYVTGLAGWLASAARQHANLQYLDGMTTVGGIVLACMLAAAVGASQRTGGGWLAAGTVGLIAATLAAWLGSHVVFLGLGCFGLVSRVRSRMASATATQVAGLCYLTAWFAALLAVTPLYHPYPRLVLLWLCSAWLAAALGMDALLTFALNVTGDQRRLAVRAVAGVLLSVAVAGLALRVGPLLDRGVPGWRARTGLQRVAVALRNVPAKGGAQGATLFCVYGEPALFFQLRAQGAEQAIPVGEVPRPEDLQGTAAARPVLIVGPHADRSPDFQREWAAAKDGYRRLSSHPYRPSDLVLLDNYDPRLFDQFPLRIKEHVTAYGAK